jgi:monoamine oxidase
MFARPISIGGHPDRSLALHQKSYFDYAARVIVIQSLIAAIKLSKLPGIDPSIVTDFDSSTQPSEAPPQEPIPLDRPICIIGAGVAGLYTAMILESLGIDYEILEADEDRIGGRIFTHRFNGKQGEDAERGTPEYYDYFDVGAMRFPRMPFMDRLFKLIEEKLKMGDLLIPYRYKGENNLKYFNTQPPLNGTTQTLDAADDYFQISVSNLGTVPDDYVNDGFVDHWTGLIYNHYKRLFGKLDNEKDDQKRREIFNKAWKKLTMQDYYSIRGYMLSDGKSKPVTAPKPYPPTVVDWLETFETATGRYDEGFVEGVIRSLDFEWPHPQSTLNPEKTLKQPTSNGPAKPTEWFCIDGGSDRIIRRMLTEIKKKPIMGKCVKTISLSDKKDHLLVTCLGEDKPREYSQVINTAALGCIGAMDLLGCELSYNQKLAIRSLNYDSSTKVGIKFAKRWWEDPSVMSAPIKGGQSSTDLPIRTCVYPSYGLQLEFDKAPGVLIASYTWAQDARRIGALAQGKGTKADEELLDLVLDNLAKLHSISREQMGPVLDHFAHGWQNDPNQRGAFALFGATQFGRPDAEAPSLYAAVKAPAAEGRLHFAGEATSIHHAWVLGSLNSGWRSVYNALAGHKDKLEKLKELWSVPDEEDPYLLDWLTCAGRGGQF